MTIRTALHRFALNCDNAFVVVVRPSVAKKLALVAAGAWPAIVGIVNAPAILALIAADRGPGAAPRPNQAPRGNLKWHR